MHLCHNGTRSMPSSFLTLLGTADMWERLISVGTQGHGLDQTKPQQKHKGDDFIE